MRTPKDVVRDWVDAFNRSDADALAELYADDATNHQVMLEPVVGRAAIHEMFRREFATAEMVCIVENLFEDGVTPRACAGAGSSTSSTVAFGSSAVTGIGCPSFASKGCRFRVSNLLANRDRLCQRPVTLPSPSKSRV